MGDTPTRHGTRGFTLLEMLIALSIFGLLAVMSYGGLSSVLEQGA
jgi:general secretion pathway protein J